jgi:hypothetical protein
MEPSGRNGQPVTTRAPMRTPRTPSSCSRSTGVVPPLPVLAVAASERITVLPAVAESVTTSAGTRLRVKLLVTRVLPYPDEGLDAAVHVTSIQEPVERSWQNEGATGRKSRSGPATRCALTKPKRLHPAATSRRQPHMARRGSTVSTPSEGSAKVLQIRALSGEATCRIASVWWVLEPFMELSGPGAAGDTDKSAPIRCGRR